MTQAHAIVLGTAQDGGFPHAGCKCEHCDAVHRSKAVPRRVACLGLVAGDGRGFLVDATPDLGEQVNDLPGLSGLFLTHAHMGHVAGLLALGMEAMAVRGLRTWLGEGLLAHLTDNEPWATLFRDDRLAPHILTSGTPVKPTPDLTITPIQVPHRGEWSETFAFKVKGPNKTLLYVPDIDAFDGGWLENLLEGVDAALIDGSFYADGEIPGRDMTKFPHPLVTETLDRLERLQPEAAVSFTHLNHTNPLVLSGSDATREIARRYTSAGLTPATAAPVARDGEILAL